MSVLPYCVFLQNSATELPHQGVGGSRLDALDEGPLRALYSEMEQQRISSQSFKEDAFRFHDVVHAVFARAAVVPFRFPTWLTLAELRRHLGSESERYLSFLRAHGEHVQMEVRLAPSPPTVSGPPATTGTEHLRQRAARQQDLRANAGKLQQALAGRVLEWRVRESAEGLRLYALVARDQVAGFRERLGQDRLAQKFKVSGPWPAAEFLPEAE